MTNKKGLPLRIFLLQTAPIRVRAALFSLTLLGIGGSALGFSLATPALVSADANNTISFQAQLNQTNGQSVANGNYNVEFKLYNSASGGQALWTEDYLNAKSQGANVTSGYLTVQLGSITAFPSNINWSQNLWVTMNIGGTGSTPSWDGEMNPRLPLTAVPYAFQANQLKQTSGSNISTLDWSSQTASNDILLPNKSGTLCIDGDVQDCGFAPGSGNSYVQNGTSLQSGANFNIGGNGTINGNLYLGSNSAIVGSPGGNVLLQAGTADTSSNTSGSVIARANGTDSSTTPAFAVQAASSTNLLAAYTGNSTVRIGTGSPTLLGTGTGDLYVTGSGEFGVELRVGNGTNGLNFVTGLAPSASNPLFNGTSQPIETINEIPAFNGMITSNNTNGSLTTAFDNSAVANSTTPNFRNYYNWTTTNAAAQTETLYVQIPVPRNFGSLTQGDQICYNTYTDDTSGKSSITATFYDTTNTAQQTYTATPTLANTWQQMCTTNIGGTITVNGSSYVSVVINLTAAPNQNVRLGNFTFDYQSAF